MERRPDQPHAPVDEPSRGVGRERRREERLHETMAREANPERFDRVTFGLIVSGLLLSGSGLGLANACSDRGRGVAQEQER